MACKRLAGVVSWLGWCIGFILLLVVFVADFNVLLEYLCKST